MVRERERERASASSVISLTLCKGTHRYIFVACALFVHVSCISIASLILFMRYFIYLHKVAALQMTYYPHEATLSHEYMRVSDCNHHNHPNLQKLICLLYSGVEISFNFIFDVHLIKNFFKFNLHRKVITNYTHKNTILRSQILLNVTSDFQVDMRKRLVSSLTVSPISKTTICSPMTLNCLTSNFSKRWIRLGCKTQRLSRPPQLLYRFVLQKISPFLVFAYPKYHALQDVSINPFLRLVRSKCFFFFQFFISVFPKSSDIRKGLTQEKVLPFMK